MGKFFSISFFLLLTFASKAQVVPVDSVNNYIGKEVVVYGEIMDGRYLVNATNKPTLLNMGGKFPNQKLTVVIYGEDRGNFGYKPEELLLNKVIYVTGKVELYRDQPQIKIAGPFDISFSNPMPGAQPVDANKKKDKEKVAKENKSGKNSVETDVAKNKFASRLPIGSEIILPSTMTLKSGAGNQFAKVTNLKKGTVVIIISVEDEWTKIMEKNAADDNTHITGYVRSDRLL